MTAFADLWRFYPAALYAFAVLLGSSVALYSEHSYFLLFSLTILALPLITSSLQSAQLRIVLALILALASFYMTSTRYLFPIENTAKTGIADIEMTSVRLMKTPFGFVWNYKGTLKSFIHHEQVIAKDIPILVSIPFEKASPRPPAHYRYELPARLKTSENGKYVITPVKNAKWHTKNELHNLAEWRFSAKAAVQKHVQESIKDHHVGAFLSGIATGEFDDRILSHELGRFGLQHLMAISGLHFSILSTFIALVLGVFFSRKTAAIITIVVMSAYFVFLGASASVTRAWIAIIIALASLFIQRRSSGFNALGIGALALLLWDPLIIEELGFQFSFGITASILLWFSPCEKLLQQIFAKRRLNDVTKMDSWDQHGYCLLYFLRQSLALSLAVNIAALPLTLYHFHVFPLMGLVYNLFFPVLVSLSLVLLTTACCFSLIFPWLASQIHALNEYYTQFVLNFAFNLPKTFDYTWRVESIPIEGLMIYLAAVLIGGLFLSKRSHNEELIC